MIVSDGSDQPRGLVTLPPPIGGVGIIPLSPYGELVWSAEQSPLR